MKLTYIFLSIFLVFSCITKRKIENTKQLDITKNILKTDSFVRRKIEKKVNDSSNNYTKQINLLSKIGLSYVGKNNNDKGKVQIKQKEDNLEIDIEGNIKMVLDKNYLKNENIFKNKHFNITDSTSNIHIKKENSIFFKKIEKIKDKYISSFRLKIFIIIFFLLFIFFIYLARKIKIL